MMKKQQHDHQDAADITKPETAAAVSGQEDEALVDIGTVPETAAEPDAAAAPEAAATAPETEKLRAEVAELNDKYLRLHAEFENFRKRSFKDISNARTNAVVDAVIPFLRILDIFNMAIASAQTAPNVEAIKQGLQMIMTEYGKAFDELGVVKFDAVGQPFDHSRHDAMAKEPSDQPEGTVIKQWSCGYQLGDRLLRPARVVVSSGPEGQQE